jgi:hypothetical protein
MKEKKRNSFVGSVGRGGLFAKRFDDVPSVFFVDGDVLE